MSKRVIVTGAAGFIGSHIVDGLLEAGCEPHAVDDLSSGSRDNLPDGVQLHVVDVRDRDAVKGVFAAVRPALVCHQAAQMSVSRSVREPAFDASVNVMGLLNVMDAAVGVGVERVVFASSGGVLYGDVSEPVDENHPASPISPYGITKWVGEKYLAFYAAEHGIETVALRYSNVYGPRQNPHGEAGVVAIFCTKMLNGEAATINGDGRYIRDYVYCEDVARANLLAMERPLPERFVALNIGTGMGTDVNELEEAIRALTAGKMATDVPEPTPGPARAGDLRSNLVDAALAGKLLGWSPEVKLHDGLKRTVDWFQEKTAPR